MVSDERGTARLRQGGVGEVGCSNPSCICHDPTKSVVCGEWMGYVGDEFCPRCGWNRAAHPTVGAALFGRSDSTETQDT